MAAAASHSGSSVSLRSRTLLAFLVPSLVVFALGSVVLSSLSRSILEAQLGRSLCDLAAGLASTVRAERVLSLTPEDASGEGSRTWRSLSTQIADWRQATGARRVVIFDTARLARIDSGGGLPIGAEVPETLRDARELEQVLAGQRAASQVLFEGNDGRLYKTGYAPMLADGRVVAVVGVEGDAAFFGPLQTLRQALVGLGVLLLLVLAAVALLTARATSAPLMRLVDSALRIGRGDLETRVEPQPTREIGTLAAELESMRQALYSRDQQLKMMIGGVAHEVKNPLGGMELFSGLMREELTAATPDLTEVRSHLERVTRELEYLKRIVEDFLQYAREERLGRTALSSLQLLQGVADRLQADALTAQVELRVEGEATPLEGDESLLTGALVNLVKNALQVSTAGQRVMLRTVREGTRVRLEIADAGPGIAPELQGRIFEPFFTTKQKGTGLGLALARKLIEAHRGTLTVRSRPGETVFVVDLPVGAA